MPLNFRHTVTIRILASLNIWYVPLMISADSTFKLNLRICLQILTIIALLMQMQIPTKSILFGLNLNGLQEDGGRWASHCNYY